MAVQFISETESPPEKEEAPVAVNDGGASKAFDGANSNTTRGIDGLSIPDGSVAPASSESTEPEQDFEPQQGSQRSGRSAKPSREFDPNFKPTSKETLIERATREYLALTEGADLPLAKLRDSLLRHINNAIAAEAAARHSKMARAPQLTTLEVLDEITVARVIIARERVVSIDLTEGAGSEDLTLLALYQQSGPDEGVYRDDETPLRLLISELRPSSTANQVKSILQLLSTLAPRVRRTVAEHLVPVGNGVFDHLKQELLPFSPEYVFLSKSEVSYDPTAESPAITMPDGEEWDFDSWLASLSDDEGVPELLWEIIGATLRPQAPWHKTAMLAGPEGNGGKGTIVQLLRNLVGERAYSAVKIEQFGEKFATAPLLRSSANLVDENPVGSFAKDVSDWKSAITGDVIQLERKYRDPVQMRWLGFEVQCLNTLTPKMKDTSASLKRRLLIVPMTKSFEGIERKYIKSDYLARPDVLQYVLRRALEMTHTELSNPPACKQALEHWYGANNKVVGFWQEFEPQFTWDMLPYSFLYDLFVAWYRQTEPSGTPMGRPAFLESLKAHLSRSTEWELHDPLKRTGKHMAAPEPLIGEYDLEKWKNSTYSGNDHSRTGMFDHPAANYRGVVVRVVPRAKLAAAGYTVTGPVEPERIE